MKMIIQTEKDLQFLQGKFVLQVNTNTPDQTLMECDWGFVKEKRLKIVCGLGFADLYGNVYTHKTFEDFKNVFNDYLYSHMIEKGEPGGDRFHRLLTNKELDYLRNKLKEENY